MPAVVVAVVVGEVLHKPADGTLAVHPSDDAQRVECVVAHRRHLRRHGDEREAKAIKGGTLHDNGGYNAAAVRVEAVETHRAGGELDHRRRRSG